MAPGNTTGGVGFTGGGTTHPKGATLATGLSNENGVGSAGEELLICVLAFVLLLLLLPDWAPLALADVVLALLGDLSLKRLAHDCVLGAVVLVLAVTGGAKFNMGVVLAAAAAAAAAAFLLLVKPGYCLLSITNACCCCCGG